MPDHNHPPPTVESPAALDSHGTAALARRAWLPIPVFLAATLLLNLFQFNVAYEPPYLLLILNIVFLAAGSLLVAGLAGRAYLLGTALPVLLLGCAMLGLGVASIVAGAAVHYGHINIGVTIYNLGLWLSALCHLAAAVTVLIPTRPRSGRAPGIALTVAYILALATITAIAFAAFDRYTPIFYVQARGPTLLRQLVLGSAVAMFASAALLLRIVHTRTTSRFAYWYSLSLALTATGLLAIMTAKTVGCPVTWIGRSAQYLGSIYLLVAVLKTLRKAGVTGLNLQAALRQSEQRYRSFFDDDLTGDFLARPDGALLECNPAFAQIYGFENPQLAAHANMTDFNSDAWNDLVDRVKKHQRVYAYQTTQYLPDDRRISILANVVGEFDDAGQLTHIKGYVFENTQTQLVQDRLRDVALFPEENPFPVLRVAADGELLYANRAAADLLAQWRCTLGDTVPADVQSLVRTALDTGQQRQWETPCQGRFLSLVLAPVAKRRYVNFYALDVTERKHAEDALRNERDFINSLLSTASALVVVLDTDGRILRFNRACEQLTGFSFDELKGKTFWDFLLVPEEAEPVKRVFQNLCDGHFPNEHENFWLTRSGQRRLIHWTNSALADPDGNIQCIIATGIDITERKHAEEALRDRETRLRTVMKNLTEGLVVSDLNGTMLEWNQAALTLHGITTPDKDRRELSNFTSMFELRTLDGAVLPVEQWPMPRILRGEELRDFQVRIRHLEKGWQRVFSYGGTLARDAAGAPVLAVITIADITERKKAEEALRQSRDLLEQRVHDRTAQLAESNRQLEQRSHQLARLASELTLTEQRERRRLATLLHEHLQQLLVGAKFGLEVLARRADQDQQDAIEQVAGLIDESIGASRSLTIELSPPILHEAGLPAGLEWLTRWMKEKQGLDVHLQLDGDAHTDREDLRILLFQAARELLFNVVKHAGVTSATIQLQCPDPQHLCLTVADQGRGFDAETIWSPTRDLSGGFGLFSIRERVALLGGQLHIDSAPQQGARITITAPLRKSQPTAFEQTPMPSALQPLPAEPAGDTAAATIIDPQPAAGPTNRPLIRLLLVDDHTVMRHGLSLLLADEDDIDVVGEAADGFEAIEQARKLHPDVILMDYSMPRMDGQQATRAIHHEMPGIRIIGLSMYDQADRAAAMLDAGAVAYLSKTENPDKLLNTIRKIR